MKRFYQFIINPKSGNSLEISVLRRLRDELVGRGHRVKVDVTRSLSHAGQLAREAVGRVALISGGGGDGSMPKPEACRVHIVVAGGDGTMREVAGAIQGRGVPVLLVPTGTENLLAQELGLDGSIGNLLAALDHGRLRGLDLGLVNGHTFMSIVGVGFDAQVVNYVIGRRSGHITPVNYLWPICRTFWEYTFPPVRVEADGAPVCEGPALVFVSNVSRYAGGLLVSPMADCGDGLLDLTVLACGNHWELMYHSLRTAGRLGDWPGRVIRKRCRTIRIDSPRGTVPVEMDGEPCGGLPLRIEAVPSAVWMLSPPGPAEGRHCPPVRYYHLKRWVLR